MKIEIFEGRRAQDYDKNIPVLFPGYEMIQEQICQLLDSNMISAHAPQILTAGCGTGSEMYQLLNYNPSWQVTGVDPSPQMIAKANDKLSSISTKSFKLQTGLVSDLPNNIMFDAATLQLVLHFLPDNGDKLSLLKNISERMKSNSPFILVDIFGDKNFFNFHINQLKNILFKKISSDVVEKMMTHIQNDLFVCTEERQLELLQQAGFGEANRFFQNFMYGAWIAFKK